jgi:hypothetical protein
MEIKPNRFVQSAFPVTGSASTKPTGASAPATSFEGSNGLNAALAAAPDVRPDVVRRAEGLVSSPTYPSKEIMNKIATLLAGHISSQQ